MQKVLFQEYLKRKHGILGKTLMRFEKNTTYFIGLYRAQRFGFLTIFTRNPIF